MRTKPGVDSLSFDDLYNNLRVFESDIKGSTASSSSSPQNVAFVSENTSSTNEVSTAYCVPNLSGQNSKYEQPSSYSLLANQSSCPQLDHEDLEQIDEYDLEEMDLKWQVAMISMRMKKFYKKTGRKLQFDAKEPVGFDKTKVECHNCHKTGHFARECKIKGTHDNRRRDAWNYENKDGTEQDNSDTEVISCSTKCKESYANLKKLYDAQREKLSDASIEIKAYSQGLKKVETVSCSSTRTTLTQPSKSESQSSEFDTCESNISAEPSELVSEPVVNESIVECQPKVWSDAPIIEEYESDSEDEENVKSQFKHSQKPKVDKKDLGYGFTVRSCFVCGSLNHLIRDCDFHEKRMARKAELNNGWDNDYPHRALKKQRNVINSLGWYFSKNLRMKQVQSLRLIRQIKNQLNQKVKTIRSDNGIEFKNKDVIEFCGSKGIKREYSNARTPQQNGVAESRNRTLIDCFVLPIWPSYSSTITPDLKTDEKRMSRERKNSHYGMNIERLKRLEKELRGSLKLPRKSLSTLVIKERAARTSSTNLFSTVSTPAKASQLIYTKIETQNPLVKDEEPVDVDVPISIVHDWLFNVQSLLHDSDYAEQIFDRKSTNRRLAISWQGDPFLAMSKSIPLGHFNYRRQNKFAAGKQLWASFVDSKSNVRLWFQPSKPSKRSSIDNEAPIIFTPDTTLFKILILGWTKDMYQDNAKLVSTAGQKICTAIRDFEKNTAGYKSDTSPANPTSEVPTEPQTDSSPAQTSEGMRFRINQGNTTLEAQSQTQEAKLNLLSSNTIENKAEKCLLEAKDFPIKSFSKKHSAQRSVSQTGREVLLKGCGEDKRMVDEDKEINENKIKTYTDGQRKGTEDHTKEEIATQATQTPTQMPTSTIFGDDETIAKVLLNMSQAKAVSREKEKGVELKDIEEADKPRPTSTRSLLTLKPLLKIDPKDKGKKKIKEEDESESESDGIPEAEKKFKQLESDEEMARKIQEEWEGEEERNRIAEEKATNEALIRNFDDIKARIEADRLLAEKLQEQEREQFTIEERAKFLPLHNMPAQRKIPCSSKIRGYQEQPPTRNQQRNQYDDLLEALKKNDPRKRRYIQNTSEDDSEKENDELRLHLIIAPDKEKEVDYEILDKKYPIKEWKTECLGTKPLDSEIMEKKSIIARLDKVSSPDGDYLVIYRANGNFRAFNYLIEIMMESSTEENDQSDFWSNQQDWKIITWRLYEACGVCILELEDGIVIHMLVERRYPLSKELLQRMLDLGLEVERESTVALDLIRFIKQQIDEE
ncbi:ribonuclease H-like domain-containing protein [Tanacetum coccineum]|uniref:Ribonuclease H-like domain-containing protein n=1 Tax=Tanacetum coccineum TaxID=301880 RepID=A0ABQ5ABS8_9ASTR